MLVAKSENCAKHQKRNAEEELIYIHAKNRSVSLVILGAVFTIKGICHFHNEDLMT